MNNEGAVSARRRAIRRAGVWLLLAGAALGVQPVSAQPQPQPQGQAPAPDWIISVLEGDAVVIDGVRRVTGAAGLRLEPGAIVETSAKTGIVRIEGSDQSTYDLGPDTRVMLAPPGFGTRGERAPQVYLLQGWLKGTARGPREAAGIVTPALEVLPFKGAVVLQQLKREHQAFVESGRIDLVERRLGSGSIAINAGEFFGGEGARRGSVAARPAPAWAQSVPRAFRDPIPLRAAAFRDRHIEAPALPGPTYAQLADWLTAEMTLRAALPARFAPLARERAFRAEVVSHLAAHPEWEPIVHPPERARRPSPGGSR